MADDAFDKEPRRGGFKTIATQGEYLAAGRKVPGSHPADPKLSVANAHRTPEPYKNLRSIPNLTGTYFEEAGRYRLFINHVGRHLEGLLTLFSIDRQYHQLDKDGRDRRLPADWGVMLPGESQDYEPLAYRFAGDLVGGEFYLYVPRWIGKWKLTAAELEKLAAHEHGHLAPSEVGRIDPRRGDLVIVRFSALFAARWPERTRRLFQSSKRGDYYRSRANRYAHDPVLLDRYLARSSIPFELRTQYWFCLTHQQTVALPKFAKRIRTETVVVNPDIYMMMSQGVRMGVYDLLMAERRLQMGDPDGYYRTNILTAIDAIVDSVFDFPHSEPVPQGGFGLAHEHELRAQVLRILDGWHLEATADYPRQSVSSALIRALDRYDPTKPELTALAKRLGLGPRGRRKFRYEIEIRLAKLIEFDDENTQKSYNETKKVWKRLKKELEKAGERAFERFRKFKRLTKYLPLTAMTGWATVKFVGVVEYDDPSRKPGDGPEDPHWHAEFGITLLGFKAEKSKGDGLIRRKGVAEVWGPRPVKMEDLVGPLTYGQGEAVAQFDVTPEDESKGSWSGKSGFEKAFLGFLGTSREPGVTFWLDAEIGKNTEGATASLKGMGGYAYLLGGTGLDVKLEPKHNEEEEFENYWNRRVAQLSVHFPINGARIPVPTDREWGIMLDGGTLSMKEALDAFAACELPLLAHPLVGIKIDGYADPPDKVEDNLELSTNRALTVRNYLYSVLGDTLTWSRDFPELDRLGRITTKGHGEPDPAAKVPKERKKEKFDPLLRRADIAVQIRDSIDARGTKDDPSAAGFNMLPVPNKPPKG